MLTGVGSSVAADAVRWSWSALPVVSGGDHHDELVRDPLGLLQRAAAEARAGLARLTVGDRPFLVVCTHAPAADVLDDPARAFAKPKLRPWRRLLGESVLGANGASWAAARRRARFVGGPASREIARSAAAVTAGHCATWPDDGELDLLPVMRGITLCSAFELLTGSPPELDVPLFTASLDAVLQHIQEQESAGDRPRVEPAYVVEAARQLRGQVTDAALRWSSRADGPGLLRPADPDTYRDDPELAVDDLLGYLVAGYESTATAVTWAVLLLTQHPDERFAAQEDVVAEALRLYPPAWALLRAAVRPATVAGMPVPAGAIVVCSPYLVHRDPAVFSSPEDFRPARWTGQGARALPRGAYLPFGGGRRACPGRTMAAASAAAVLAAVAERFALHPAGAPPRPEVRVTLQPPPGTAVRVRRLSTSRPASAGPARPAPRRLDGGLP